MSNALLETRGLTKRYGSSTALSEFTVALEPGKIYGLLGRNGAGKTTLLNLLTSKIFPQSGEILFGGENAVENAKALSQICYMPEKSLFPPNQKVKDILRFWSRFYDTFDRDSAARLCGQFHLPCHKKYKELSRGYESLLRVVIGLATKTPVVIFDEPTLGLDAAMRDQFYRVLIDDYTAHPRMFIISTHLIEESSDIFHDVLIVKDGRLIVHSPAEQLRESGYYFTGKSEAVAQALKHYNVVHTELVAGVRISAVYQEIPPEELARIRGTGVEISPVPVQKLFIYLTDSGRRDPLE